MTPCLEVRDLNAGYGSATDAISGISFGVTEGESVGIAGANGAGKSTLLKVIAGAHQARGGTVLQRGKPLPREGPAQRLRRGIVLLPEGHQVIPNLTVQENLQLASISLWPQRSQRHLDEVLPIVFDLFPILHDRREQLAGFLSGGQQQMLGIGRALVSSPEVLLLDEPSLGLAPVVIADIYGSLQMLSERGISLVVVEQAVDRLRNLTDRVHVMRLGRIVDGGSWDEVDEERIRSAYFG